MVPKEAPKEAPNKVQIQEPNIVRPDEKWAKWAKRANQAKDYGFQVCQRERVSGFVSGEQMRRSLKIAVVSCTTFSYLLYFVIFLNSRDRSTNKTGI